MEGQNSSDLRPQYAIVPGQSLAQLRMSSRNPCLCSDKQLTSVCLDLGASIHEILHLLKADKKSFANIHLHYEPKAPLEGTVSIATPGNGFRLRFDGKDQRLRLIEITDFTKLRLAYKGSELSKDGGTAEGPTFKRIYQLFRESYPGEYLPPKNSQGKGQYVLSWAGIAFIFPLQHSAYSPAKDHVSMLSSTAASPATVMSLFDGNSWPEVRNSIFTRTPSGPRLSAIATRPKDNLPAEIELANVRQDGRIELQRRTPAPPFMIVLNETTPQDLITELGAPDATHKRSTDTVPSDTPARHRASSMSNGRPHPGSQPSSYSSTGTDTFDADFDSGDADEDPTDRSVREVFWCYFSHGMDILIGPQNDESTNLLVNGTSPRGSSPHLVVLKVIIHGNVPGSYAFNRHRRLRWTLDFPDQPYIGDLNSETSFDTTDGLRSALLHVFKDVWPEADMGRGKVVNRVWGESGGVGMIDSNFLLDAEQELVESGGSEQWLGNTKLFAFPGLGFEVLEGGAVAALTVY